MRIGIDVGGTNTDAVLMDGEQVLAAVKTSTTPDVTDGIVAALRALGRATQLRPRRRAGRDDRHDALHERDRRGAAARADGGDPARPPRDARAPADGRLARPPRGGARPPRLPLPRRARVRRPHDLPPRPRRAAAPWPRTSPARGSARSRSRRCSAPVNAEFETEAAAIVREVAPGAHDLPLARDRAHGPARARERDDHQRLPARPGGGDHRRVRPRDRRRRDQRPAVPLPERRHADGRRLRAPLPRRHLRLRADELHARRGVPVGARGVRGGRRRRHDHRRRHPPQAASRARPRPRSTSAACAPTSACPTC